MKLKTRMTLLVSEEGVRMEIQDELSGEIFFRADIPSGAFCSMLGRLACVGVDAEIRGLDRVGMKMEIDKFVFEMPSGDLAERKQTAIQLVQKLCPEGWTPDLYFGSQNSFFRDGDKPMAQATIRRWVPATPASEDGR